MPDAAVDHRCANCGVSMFAKPLYRTSPMGEAFVGQCGECMRRDELPVDPDLEELADVLSEWGGGVGG